MSDQDYSYPEEVCFDIQTEDQVSYSLVAERVNRQGFDILSVQHEYGIFGGAAGRYLLDLLRAIKVPIVTTLHTVLRNPTEDQRAVMEKLLQLSTRIVVMSRTAIELLTEVHGIDLSKLDFIPHGIPRIPSDAGCALRSSIAGDGPIVLTFGLLSPDKGIENVILALPRLVEEFPTIKYLVVGATHPHVRAFAGETYRNRLFQLVQDHSLNANVEFVDEFVSKERLIEYLSATHFYVTPYLNPMQITSGTLAYSLGAGKVVISTPYEYAKEVLAEGRGILVPFASPSEIAVAIRTSWNSRTERSEMGAKAQEYGAQMYWDQVGKEYMDTFNHAKIDTQCPPLPVDSFSSSSLPITALRHLEELSGEVGIMQHAIFSVPNWDEGYCVDDNARALILTIQLEPTSLFDSHLKLLQSRYFAFVINAFDPKIGKFRNFMNLQREWLEVSGSEDSQGRSMWALGTAASRIGNPHNAALAAKIFELAIPSLMEMQSPRTWAYAILGTTAYLEKYTKSTSALRLLECSAHKLDQLFELNALPGWLWPEARIAYANARLPQALITAGSFLENQRMRNRGLDSLEWLLERQVSSNGCFSPVGSEGASPGDFGSIQFDQQPIEASSSVSACLTAFATTGDERFLMAAHWCFRWFLGGNVHGLPLANVESGSCFDGLLLQGVNQNQGAESTLSYLSALTELQSAAFRGASYSRSRGLI